MFMQEEDVKNIFFVWFKKYEKCRWVKAGEYIVHWVLFPNYDPSLTQKRLAWEGVYDLRGSPEA